VLAAQDRGDILGTHAVPAVVHVDLRRQLA